MVPPEGRSPCKPFRLWHWEGLKGAMVPDLSQSGTARLQEGGWLMQRPAEDLLAIRPDLHLAHAPLSFVSPGALV